MIFLSILLINYPQCLFFHVFRDEHDLRINVHMNKQKWHSRVIFHQFKSYCNTKYSKLGDINPFDYQLLTPYPLQQNLRNFQKDNQPVFSEIRPASIDHLSIFLLRSIKYTTRRFIQEKHSNLGGVPGNECYKWNIHTHYENEQSSRKYCRLHYFYNFILNRSLKGEAKVLKNLLSVNSQECHHFKKEGSFDQYLPRLSELRKKNYIVEDISNHEFEELPLQFIIEKAFKSMRNSIGFSLIATLKFLVLLDQTKLLIGHKNENNNEIRFLEKSFMGPWKTLTLWDTFRDISRFIILSNQKELIENKQFSYIDLLYEVIYKKRVEITISSLKRPKSLQIQNEIAHYEVINDLVSEEGVGQEKYLDSSNIAIDEINDTGKITKKCPYSESLTENLTKVISIEYEDKNLDSALKKSYQIQESSYEEHSSNTNTGSGTMKDSLYNPSRIHFPEMQGSKIKLENLETNTQIFLFQDLRNQICDPIPSIDELAPLSDELCLPKFYINQKPPPSALEIPEINTTIERPEFENNEIQDLCGLNGSDTAESLGISFKYNNFSQSRTREELEAEINVQTRVIPLRTVFSDPSRPHISDNTISNPQKFRNFSIKHSNVQASINPKCDGNPEEMQLELQISNKKIPENLYLSVKNRPLKSPVPNSTTDGRYVCNKKVFMEKNDFPPSMFPEIYIFGIKKQQHSDEVRSKVNNEGLKSKNCAFCDEYSVSLSNDNEPPAMFRGIIFESRTYFDLKDSEIDKYAIKKDKKCSSHLIISIEPDEIFKIIDATFVHIKNLEKIKAILETSPNRMRCKNRHKRNWIKRLDDFDRTFCIYGSEIDYMLKIKKCLSLQKDLQMTLRCVFRRFIFENIDKLKNKITQNVKIIKETLFSDDSQDVRLASSIDRIPEDMHHCSNPPSPDIYDNKLKLGIENEDTNDESMKTDNKKVQTLAVSVDPHEQLINKYELMKIYRSYKDQYSKNHAYLPTEITNLTISGKKKFFSQAFSSVTRWEYEVGQLLNNLTEKLTILAKEALENSKIHRKENKKD